MPSLKQNESAKARRAVFNDALSGPHTKVCQVIEELSSLAERFSRGSPIRNDLEEAVWTLRDKVLPYIKSPAESQP